MEGPRAVAPHEMASLSRLVDTVFVGGAEGRMFADFPTLFHERNRENLIVFSESGTVVSHVGQVYRWATLGGCTVRVSLIGSVATLESHRGARLAGHLFAAACEKARADGIDYMMISGDRTLYLSAGATFVGRDLEATLHRAAANRLVDCAVEVVPGTAADVPFCAAAYDAKPARFVRPLDDWKAFVETGQCAGSATWSIVRWDGEFGGYIVHQINREAGLLRIGEWGGEPRSVLAALGPLMSQYGADHAALHVQSGDATMEAAVRSAGATLRQTPASGTHLLVNFPQLMARLRPWFEARIGLDEAADLEFTQDGERYTFALGNDRHTVEGKAAAARLIFGHGEYSPPEGVLRRLFPIPSLWYGISYI